MAEQYPDEMGFWVLGRGQLTFAEWDGEANRLARGLRPSAWPTATGWPSGWRWATPCAGW